MKNELGPGDTEMVWGCGGESGDGLREGGRCRKMVGEGKKKATMTFLNDFEVIF